MNGRIFIELKVEFVMKLKDTTVIQLQNDYLVYGLKARFKSLLKYADYAYKKT